MPALPLCAVTMYREGGPVISRMLGPDLAAGERPQHVVPANWWQTARSLGDWTLVGCTVAPGFDFASFELAPAGLGAYAEQEAQRDQ